MASKSSKNQGDKQTSERGAWKKLFTTVAVIGFGIFYMLAGREFVNSHQPVQDEANYVTVQKVESGVGVTVLLMDSGEVYTVPVEFGIRADAGKRVTLDKQDNQVQLCIDDHCEIGKPM